MSNHKPAVGVMLGIREKGSHVALVVMNDNWYIPFAIPCNSDTPEEEIKENLLFEAKDVENYPEGLFISHTKKELGELDEVNRYVELIDYSYLLEDTQ